MLVI
jgi:hypothetical protein